MSGVSMAHLEALCRDVGGDGAVWLNPASGKVVVRRGVSKPPRRCHNCPAPALPERSRCEACTDFEAAKREAARS